MTPAFITLSLRTARDIARLTRYSGNRAAQRAKLYNDLANAGTASGSTPTAMLDFRCMAWAFAENANGIDSIIVNVGPL